MTSAATSERTVSVEGRRERKKRETRARILEAALELFRQGGFDATTVDRIAEAADVSRQTFFNHFPEKSALVSELGDVMAAQFLASLEHARGHEAPTRGRLESLFAESAQRLLRAPDLSRLLLHETVATRRDIQDRRGRTARLHEGIAALLADGIELGDVRDDLPVSLLAEIVSGGFTEILVTWLVEPDYPLEERLHAAAGLLGDALARGRDRTAS